LTLLAKEYRILKMRTGKWGKKRGDSEGAQAGEAKCPPVPVRLG